MRHKYNAQVTYLDGKRFDSKREAQRYSELRLLEKNGQIKQLSVHPIYYLQPDFIDSTGKKQRPIKYEGDFAYTENGKKICEDTKGFETQAFKIKRKMFLYKFPDIELRIIK